MKHVPDALNTVIMLHYSNRQLLPRQSRVYENGEFWTDIKLLLLLPHSFLNLQVLGRFSKLQEATTSCVMCLFVSVCPSVSRFAWNNSVPTAQIFMKFDIWVIFENLSRKPKFYYNLTRITGTLHEDQYTFFSYRTQFKSCRKNDHIFHVQLLFS